VGLDDEVVALLVNRLFTVDERVEMRREATMGFGNVRSERLHGRLADFCTANGITAVVKSLRAVSDFEYEMQMAQMNYRLAKVETMLMTTNPLYSFLCSTWSRRSPGTAPSQRSGPRASRLPAACSPTRDSRMSQAARGKRQRSSVPMATGLLASPDGAAYRRCMRDRYASRRITPPRL
jgi:Cytidylyltransferase-like